MKMHKITMYVVDFDDIGLESLENLIECNRYMIISRFKGKTADIGEWDDDHILNYHSTPIEEFEKYFEESKE